MEYAMTKICPYHFTAILLMSMPALTSYMPDATAPESENKIKLIAHIWNTNFGPGNPIFDACQSTAVKAFKDHGHTFNPEAFFTLKEDATEHYDNKSNFIHHGYYLFKEISLSFAVRMEDANSMIMTTGTVVPYNLKEFKGKFFDISLSLSQKKWEKVTGYSLMLEAHSFNFPMIQAGDSKPRILSGTHTQLLSGTFTHRFAKYYATPGKKEFHVFNKLSLVENEMIEIVRAATDPTHIYQEFIKQRGDNLDFIDYKR